MILKQVIKYSNANVLEVTWVDENGNVVKCHAYADVQMNELRADLGADATEYEAMIAEVEANIVPSTPEPIVIPQVVSPLQARLALNEMGLRQAVEDAVAVATQDSKDFYEFALEWKRDNVQLKAMATSLGMTSIDLDNFFMLASSK